MSRILICDDEAGIRESLKLILEDDYDITLSSDRQECLNLLEGKDLLILGIRKCDLDILKRVKEINPSLKTILILNYKDTDLSGSEDYVVKPFSSKEILAKVKGQLD
ncbi:MAG: hypothetical protein ABIA97_01825 [Candidatus Omnitrophota bacterium]